MKPEAKKRKEKRIFRKREEILNIAEKTAKEKGFSELTFNSIADQMGVSSNALYYYFESIESILIEIGIRDYETLTKMFENCLNSEESGISQVLEMGKAYYRFATGFPHYREAFHQVAHLIEKSKELEDSVSKFSTIWINSVKSGQEDGSITKNIDGTILALILGKISSGFIDELHHSESLIRSLETNMEEVVNTTLEILKKGLKP